MTLHHLKCVNIEIAKHGKILVPERASIIVLTPKVKCHQFQTATVQNLCVQAEDILSSAWDHATLWPFLWSLHWLNLTFIALNNVNHHWPHLAWRMQVQLVTDLQPHWTYKSENNLVIFIIDIAMSCSHWEWKHKGGKRSFSLKSLISFIQFTSSWPGWLRII